MNEDGFDDQSKDFTPMDSYYWIAQGALDFLRENLDGEKASQFEKRYRELFDQSTSKVAHLITNDLDKGNVYFTLIAVSTYEALLELGYDEEEAMQLTDDCLNKPMGNYMAMGLRRFLDHADNPFQEIVQASKDREETYFGESFEFERPIDDKYGYVLHIKKCLFHEVLRTLDRKELQPILCKMDLSWINAIDPKNHNMQFVRPVTFATGSICQMWFMQRERELIGG